MLLLRFMFETNKQTNFFISVASIATREILYSGVLLPRSLQSYLIRGYKAQ